MKTQINKDSVNLLPHFLPWQPDLAKQHVLFKPLRELWPFERFSKWPKLDDYNLHYQYQMQHNACWQFKKFVSDTVLDRSNLSYEQMIYFKNLVPTRANNWHDFFNYLTWIAWPKSKNALNKRTMLEYFLNPELKYKARRGPLNHLARFEECGLVIVATRRFLQWIRQHQWHEVFVKHRVYFHQEVKVAIYGHGLYEKLLNPYKGLTGFAVMLESDDKIVSIDEKLSNAICDKQNFQDRNYLQPFPLLGIPGTWPENEYPNFYEDKRYFRPKRILA